MTRFIKAGAVVWALWGLLHLGVGLGGLLPALRGDMVGALGQLAGAAPPDAANGLHPAVEALIANHALNLAWGGLFAIIVALTLNWRASRIGYWVNLGVISGFDIGFLILVVVPGHIDPMIGAIGPTLWLLGAALGAPALRAR